MKNSKKELPNAPGSRMARGAIRLYQLAGSPDTGLFRAVIQGAGVFLPNAGCRFFPSCSEYALAAVSQYGLFRGSVMALGRIASCNPFSRGGYDPVLPHGREKPDIRETNAL